MGTKFFHSKPGVQIRASNPNMAARAFGSSQYTARASGGAAQKDLGAASALGKMKGTQVSRSSAYAPGPKKV